MRGSLYLAPSVGACAPAPTARRMRLAHGGPPSGASPFPFSSCPAFQPAHALPGSAIRRCCSASTSTGVTFASTACSLFFQPATTALSPSSIAS